jgi:methylmalonyl-CoA/ethylmalonyl-CoA epimerase
LIQKVHHVGIAVRDLEAALRFYRDLLGLHVHQQAVVEEQGVKAALLTVGESEIELLEPTGPDTPVGRFLARRGEGLHHLCFQTDDVAREPRRGLAGLVCFLHPRAHHGVLVELTQPRD